MSAAVGSSMTKIEAALPPSLTSVLAIRTSIWSPVLQPRHLLSRIDVDDLQPGERLARARG